MRIQMPRCFQYNLPDLKRTLIALSIHDNGAEEFHHPSHWDWSAVIKTLGVIAFIATALGVVHLGIRYYAVTINAV